MGCFRRRRGKSNFQILIFKENNNSMKIARDAVQLLYSKLVSIALVARWRTHLLAPNAAISKADSLKQAPVAQIHARNRKWPLAEASLEAGGSLMVSIVVLRQNFIWQHIACGNLAICILEK